MQASLSRLKCESSKTPPSQSFHTPSSFPNANQNSSRSNNRKNYQNFNNRGPANFQNTLFQSNRPQNGPQSSYRTSTGVPICSRCQKRGHTAPNCFQRTQNQSFSPNRTFQLKNFRRPLSVWGRQGSNLVTRQ